MPSIALKKTQAFVIADAQSVLKAAVRHWLLLRALGATDVERKTAEATIREAADALAALPSDGAPTLEDARHGLKDSLGEYRAAADLVADGFNGVDRKLQATFRIDVPFPRADAKLKAYVTGLPAVVKKHAAKLAVRGFKKEDQDALAEQAALFQKLLLARGADRGARRAGRVALEALFDRLRRQTSYFRRLGRNALRTDDRRAEFDRVKLDARPKLQVVKPVEGEAAGAGGQG